MIRNSGAVPQRAVGPQTEEREDDGGDDEFEAIGKGLATVLVLAARRLGHEQPAYDPSEPGFHRRFPPPSGRFVATHSRL